MDDKSLLPVCYRCHATCPILVNEGGDRCLNCKHEFVRSFLHFEVLPLVEFFLEPGLSHEEAQRILAVRLAFSFLHPSFHPSPCL